MDLCEPLSLYNIPRKVERGSDRFSRPATGGSFSPKTKGATLASNPPRRKGGLWSRPATFSRNSGQVTLGYKKHRPDGWQGISGDTQPAVGPAGDVTSRGDEKKGCSLKVDGKGPGHPERTIGGQELDGRGCKGGRIADRPQGLPIIGGKPR